MKKMTLVFTIMLSLFATLAQASGVLRFEEGKHYTVLNNEASKKPNVTEYFSFYCPHCFKFESLVSELKAGLPEGAAFKKSHVDFMRVDTPEIQAYLSKALVMSKRVKNGERIVEQIFTRIHRDRKTFDSIQEVREIFIKNGTSEETLAKMEKSFSVVSSAHRMKKAQTNLSRRNILTGVPMFIVNDKYKINNREVKSAAQFKELTNFLLTL